MDTCDSQVHGIFEGRLPVLLLGNTLLVGLGKCRIVVELFNGTIGPASESLIDGSSNDVKTYGSDSERELRHGVQRRRAAVEDLLHECGEGGTGGPILGESSDLLLCGDLASKEKPEETFGKGLGPAGGLGKGCLDLRNRLATEADTLLCTDSVRTRATEEARRGIPGSRTEPSQTRAGRPRIPLCGDMSRQSGNMRRRYGPVELVNENGTEGLFAVCNTGGFHLLPAKWTGEQWESEEKRRRGRIHSRSRQE